MRLLSIDFDFFVKPTVYTLANPSERPPDKYYSFDSKETVNSFLKDKCRMSIETPIPGILIKDHVDAFLVVEELVKQNDGNSIELIHVDAHADLGHSSAAHRTLLTEYLQTPIDERPSPRDDGSPIGPGNWLAFVAANGWLSSITFIPQRVPPTDLVAYFFKDWPEREQQSSQLVFHALRIEQLNRMQSYGSSKMWYGDFDHGKPLSAPKFNTIAHHQFSLNESPYYLVACQSPEYIPPKADFILDWICPFISATSLGLDIQSPIIYSSTIIP